MIGSESIIRAGLDRLMAAPWLKGGNDPDVGLDCYGQMREILRLLWFATLPPADAGAARGHSHLGRWQEIGRGPASYRALLRPGDVLESRPIGARIHVSTAVWGDPGRMWVMSTAEAGPRQLPAYAVIGQENAWRWIPNP